jgi:transposase
VLSGIIFINHNGLRWCDAPKDYGPHKTLYNRWKRWGEMGVLARIIKGLAAEWLIADRGYDAGWFRDASRDKEIRACIPGRKSRSKPVRHDKRRYKRRIATRYERSPKVFLSAIALAATVIFWL